MTDLLFIEGYLVFSGLLIQRLKRDAISLSPKVGFSSLKLLAISSLAGLQLARLFTFLRLSSYLNCDSIVVKFTMLAQSCVSLEHCAKYCCFLGPIKCLCQQHVIILLCHLGVSVQIHIHHLFVC